MAVSDPTTGLLASRNDWDRTRVVIRSIASTIGDDRSTRATLMRVLDLDNPDEVAGRQTSIVFLIRVVSGSPSVTSAPRAGSQGRESERVRSLPKPRLTSRTYTSGQGDAVASQSVGWTGVLLSGL